MPLNAQHPVSGPITSIKKNLVAKIINRIAIGLIIGIILSLMIFQFTSIQFQEVTLRNKYYDWIVYLLPGSVMLTMFESIKKNDEFNRKVLKFFGTLFLAILALGFFYVNLFTIGFGAWTDEQIIYRKKDNPTVTIKEQVYDIGAFGYGGRRIVKSAPLLWIFEFNTVTAVSSINKKDWDLVDQEGQ